LNIGYGGDIIFDVAQVIAAIQEAYAVPRIQAAFGREELEVKPSVERVRIKFNKVHEEIWRIYDLSDGRNHQRRAASERTMSPDHLLD
jgi:hypothetical protein